MARCHCFENDGTLVLRVINCLGSKMSLRLGEESGANPARASQREYVGSGSRTQLASTMP